MYEKFSMHRAETEIGMKSKRSGKRDLNFHKRMKSDVLETKCLECFQQISRFSGHTVIRPTQEMVVTIEQGTARKEWEGRESVIEYRAKTSPGTPLGATGSSFEPSTMYTLRI